MIQASLSVERPLLAIGAGERQIFVPFAGTSPCCERSVKDPSGNMLYTIHTYIGYTMRQQWNSFTNFLYRSFLPSTWLLQSRSDRRQSIPACCRKCWNHRLHVDPMSGGCVYLKQATKCLSLWVLCSLDNVQRTSTCRCATMAGYHSAPMLGVAKAHPSALQGRPASSIFLLLNPQLWRRGKLRNKLTKPGRCDR